MIERLTDEQLAHIAADRHQPTLATATLAREVQQWRALAPEVIEQAEMIRTYILPTEARNAIDTIIAKLREVSQ